MARGAVGCGVGVVGSGSGVDGWVLLLGFFFIGSYFFFFLIIHTKLKIISCFYLNFIQNLRLYLTFILTLTKIKIKVGY